MLGQMMLLNMFAYNYRRNKQVLELARKLTAEQWDGAQDIGR